MCVHGGWGWHGLSFGEGDPFLRSLPSSLDWNRYHLDFGEGRHRRKYHHCEVRLEEVGQALPPPQLTKGDQIVEEIAGDGEQKAYTGRE